MKNKKQTWRLFFALCIFLYILAIGVSILIVRNVPNFYVNLQVEKNKEIDELIKEASIKNNKEEYQEILKEYLVDFAVYNETKRKLEYSSINLKDNDVSLFEQNVNEQLISSKKKMLLKRGNERLSLWVVEYYVSPQKTFDIWVIVLILVETLLLSLIAISLIILFVKYVKPLGRLKNAIQNISAFQLNVMDNITNSSEYDNLTKQLYDFSQELDKRIKDTGFKYSELEQSLIMQNEEISYRNKVIGSLAHDLKAPLSLINLNLEQIKDAYNISKIDAIQNKVNNVIIDINDLNKIAFNNNMFIENKNQTFDLVQLLLSIFDNYRELFNSKGLFVEFDLVEKIEINKNKIRIKQLIDNVLSNIYNHTDINGDVEIACYMENNNIILSFYNDAKDITENEINNMTNLFYSNNDNSINTGIGMYTVKMIVEELNGKLLITKEQKGIRIKVVFSYE